MTPQELDAVVERKNKERYLRVFVAARKRFEYESDFRRRMEDAEKLRGFGR